MYSDRKVYSNNLCLVGCKSLGKVWKRKQMIFFCRKIILCFLSRDQICEKILSAILVYHFAVEALLYVLEVTSSEGVKLIFC